MSFIIIFIKYYFNIVIYNYFKIINYKVIDIIIKDMVNVENIGLIKYGKVNIIMVYLYNLKVVLYNINNNNNKILINNNKINNILITII